MAGKTVFLLAILAQLLCVFCSPTSSLWSPKTNTLPNRSVQDVPMCGPATGFNCGMNVCCSGAGYCDTDEAHCSGGCQPSYGSCQIARPKRCGTNSGTTSSRTVAYYQGYNAVDRSCDVVQASDIDTSKFTHLNYAFANFNSSFNVIPYIPSEVDLYKKFTALKSDNLQTWIAIGGGISNAPWSVMVSEKANRDTFISSLESFMTQYGFQGVDLDWEVPQNQNDMVNYVSLVQDMSATFGDSFGISVAIPADYGSMFWFNASGMSPYINWFGYMAYDLRRPDGKTAAHTDITQIEHDAMPFWFDGVDPGKINLGLASYGIGYTLANTSCVDIGCDTKAPSHVDTCIDGSEGVTALFDINTLIVQRNLTPVLDSDAMVKEITFDDQWIAYDDAETIGMKKNWGNDFCFGGTMMWALDLGHFY